MSNANVKRTPNDKVSEQRSVACRISATNPFDSDSELDLDHKPPRSFSAPPISKGNCSKTSQYRHKENEEKGTPTSFFSAERNGFRNDCNGSGGIENQSVQELENYAAYKSEETTKKVDGCLRIAEEIRESASRTLVMLHQQGQQITRTHQTAVDIEYDLSRGEKLLASLGGIFSRTWKPTKASPIKGPLLTGDDSFERKGNHMEQRQRLGISGPPNTLHEPTLGELKEMAVDMGAELDRFVLNFFFIMSIFPHIGLRRQGVGEGEGAHGDRRERLRSDPTHKDGKKSELFREGEGEEITGF